MVKKEEQSVEKKDSEREGEGGRMEKGDVGSLAKVEVLYTGEVARIRTIGLA